MDTPSTVEAVIARICSIPADFHRRRDVSVVRLLEESGYALLREAITVLEIQRHLLDCPHQMDEWANYSSDKRCDGWYFDGERNAVGHFPANEGMSGEQMFCDLSRACAEFIKHEVDSIFDRASS